MEKLKNGLLTAEPCAPIDADAEALETWVTAPPGADVTAVDTAFVLVVVTTLMAGAAVALLLVVPVSADTVLTAGVLLDAAAAREALVEVALTMVGVNADVDATLVDDADSVSPAEADDDALPVFPPQPASPSTVSSARAGNMARRRFRPDIIRSIVVSVTPV